MLRHPLFVLVLVAACGDGSDAPPDAAAPDARLLDGDFSCLDTAWPTAAPDPLEIEGKVINRSGFGAASSPINGATVELYDGDGTLLGQDTTSGLASNAGTYAVSIATGGAAPTLIRKASATGFLDNYATDPVPVSATVGYLHEMQTPEARDSYYDLVGLTPDPARGTLQLFFYDCATSPNEQFVAGITVDVPPGARAIYYDEAWNLDLDLEETTGAGQVLLLDVAAGSIDITVHAGDLTYRPWPIEVHADAWNESVRHP